MTWQNDFNLRKPQTTPWYNSYLCAIVAVVPCYLALSVKGCVALTAGDVDPWQSKQFEIEEHWIVAVSAASLHHRTEAHLTTALSFNGSALPTDQMDIYKLKNKLILKKRLKEILNAALQHLRLPPQECCNIEQLLCFPAAQAYATVSDRLWL